LHYGQINEEPKNWKRLIGAFWLYLKRLIIATNLLHYLFK
jgi:hypothetical protein